MDFMKTEKWNTDDSGMHIFTEMLASTAFSDDQQDGLWDIEDDRGFISLLHRKLVRGLHHHGSCLYVLME